MFTSQPSMERTARGSQILNRKRLRHKEGIAVTQRASVGQNNKSIQIGETIDRNNFDASKRGDHNNFDDHKYS